LRTLDRDPLPQPIGDLVDREDLHHRLDRLARGLLGPDEAERLLGLSALQPVRAALDRDRSERAVQTPPVGRAPRPGASRALVVHSIAAAPG